MTFFVFWALKGPNLIFSELSKTLFGFFGAQIGPEFAGGGAERPPPLLTLVLFELQKIQRQFWKALKK